MINPEIRDIIEAELEPGEKLLWAEKISSKRVKEATNFEIEDGRLAHKVNIFISILVLIALLVFPNFRIYGLLWIIFLCLVLYINRRSNRKAIESLRDLDIGGYALTNFYYFRFGQKLNIIEKSNARKLKKVRELTNCIALSPIGRGLFFTREIRFLKNNYASAQYINSRIQNLRSENS